MSNQSDNLSAFGVPIKSDETMLPNKLKIIQHNGKQVVIDLETGAEVVEMVGDQAEPPIRDSAIKFECRLLISTITQLQPLLPEGTAEILLEPIAEIVRMENERLQTLIEVNNLASTDRNATTDTANPPKSASTNQEDK